MNSLDFARAFFRPSVQEEKVVEQPKTNIVINNTFNYNINLSVPREENQTSLIVPITII